jgi:hypothetical protein
MTDLLSAEDLSTQDSYQPILPIHDHSEVTHATEHSVTPSVACLSSMGVKSPTLSTGKPIRPDQRLFLDGLNNDVLAIVLNILFGGDKPENGWFYYDKPYFRRQQVHSIFHLSIVDYVLSVCRNCSGTHSVCPIPWVSSTDN